VTQQSKSYSYSERIAGLKHFSDLSEPEQSKLATDISHLVDNRLAITFQNMARNSEIVALKKAGFKSAYIARRTGHSESVVSRALAEHGKNRRIVALAVEKLPPPPNPSPAKILEFSPKIYPASCPKCEKGSVRLVFDPSVSAHTMDCLSCAWLFVQDSTQVAKQ